MTRIALATVANGNIRLAGFHYMLKEAHIPTPTPEYRFDLERMWRFDFAWIPEKVALECEGGIWTRGRHSRGAGMLKDMEKYNRAAVLGWRLIRVTPSTLCTAETIATIREALTHRESA